MEEGTADCLLYGSSGWGIEGDHGYAAFEDAGMAWTFAGVPMRGLIASQKGVVRLIPEDAPFADQNASFSLSGTPDDLPSVALGEHVLAPLWADLDTGGNSEVEWYPRDDRIVVLWKSLRLSDGTTNHAVSFELQLLPDGAAEAHYCDGFEGPDGAAGLDYTIGAAVGDQAVTVVEVGHVALAGKHFRFEAE